MPPAPPGSPASLGGGAPRARVAASGRSSGCGEGRPPSELEQGRGAQGAWSMSSTGSTSPRPTEGRPTGACLLSGASRPSSGPGQGVGVLPLVSLASRGCLVDAAQFKEGAGPGGRRAGRVVLSVDLQRAVGEHGRQGERLLQPPQRLTKLSWEEAHLRSAPRDTWPVLWGPPARAGPGWLVSRRCAQTTPRFYPLAPGPAGVSPALEVVGRAVSLVQGGVRAKT